MFKFYDIVNKYNNTNHRTIKMKPVDVIGNTYIDSMVFHSMIKVLNLKSLIISEFQNTKILLLKDTCQIGLKKFCNQLS